MNDRDKITVLMTLKDQKREFLTAAIDSVIQQSSPDWFFLVIIDFDTPDHVKDIIRAYCKDPRVKMLVSDRDAPPGLARGLNIGMKEAVTDFVCILLSDDLMNKDAIAILKEYIKKYPGVDFFYSSRAFIDSKGVVRSPIICSTPPIFAIDNLKKAGCPAKHLLCWRRLKGAEAGGMDEEFGLHGCDDFDFPWTMADRGCTFKAVDERLYYYRNHDDFYRLTTHIPMMHQVEILRKIFKKHRVSEKDAEEYIAAAMRGYLVNDKLVNYEKDTSWHVMSAGFRTADGKAAEFVDKGFEKSRFFPHKTYYLPKAGPDGMQNAVKMCGVSDPGKLFEAVMYAEDGLMASANLIVKGDALYANNLSSDVFQGISQRPEHEAGVENKLNGRADMLLNSVMNFALERHIKKVYLPAADLLSRYRANKSGWPGRGGWWVVDLKKNMDRIVLLEKKEESVEQFKTICVCHDIEHGLGYADTDQQFKAIADKESPGAILEMLKIEREMNVKATYNIVGCLFDRWRSPIEKDGHCIAFHSFDHKIDSSGCENPGLRSFDDPKGQLHKCRSIDRRIKGYRIPRSRITPELTDENLAYHNFEWLATSTDCIKQDFPKMQNGIVKIPVLFDDSAMHNNKLRYEEWENMAIETIKSNYFVAFGLHDCYAQYWLPHYGEFLKKISSLGTLRTMNEVAGDVIIGSAV
jgi:glycosyltransferase involved in cell wall biosynthesis